MTIPRFLSVLVALSVLAGAATARADEPTLEAPEFFWSPPPAAPWTPAPSAEVGPRWYGWQALALDASSALLLAAAAGTESAELGLAAVGGHLAASPLTHLLAHESSGRALASFLLRALLPIAGFLLGASAECQDATWLCVPEEAWIGYGVGMVTASLLDVAVLSWEGPRASP